MGQTADVDHGKVHYFGELAILEAKDGKFGKRAATVRVQSQAASLCQITLSAITDAFGSIKELLDEQELDAQEILLETMNKSTKEQKRKEALHAATDVNQTAGYKDGVDRAD